MTIFCILQKLILAIVTKDLFFLLGTNFRGRFANWRLIDAFFLLKLYASN